MAGGKINVYGVFWLSPSVRAMFAVKVKSSYDHPKGGGGGGGL